MPKDTSLLDNSGPPTLDQLKAHFQAHDFTTEQSSYDPSKATEAQNQIYVKAKGFFAESWDRQQKAMGGKGSLRNFSSAYPLQVLENANENQIARTVTQILSDPDLTERIFTLLEPMILSALSTYAESVGKSCDDLTDEEVEMVIAQFASELQGNAVNLLMQTENVPELLSELKLMQTHEDFSEQAVENWDKIDFDRKWDHTRTKIGRLLSSEDIELDVLERGQNVLDDGEEYSIEEQIFEQQMEEAFMATLDSTELEICRLRQLHYTQTEIAEALGYKTHSAVAKRIAKMREKFDAVARKLRETE
ncbi:MAG: hypothetical protein IJX76_08355 [Clostridia bacterium]|nr:hypothetical protein [Clostridia bacterium]